jgi:hypothetical protein
MSIKEDILKNFDRRILNEVNSDKETQKGYNITAVEKKFKSLFNQLIDFEDSNLDPLLDDQIADADISSTEIVFNKDLLTQFTNELQLLENTIKRYQSVYSAYIKEVNNIAENVEKIKKIIN